MEERKPNKAAQALAKLAYAKRIEGKTKEEISEMYRQMGAKGGRKRKE